MHARRLRYSVVVFTILIIIVLVTVSIATYLYINRPTTQTTIEIPPSPVVTAQQVASDFHKPTDIVSAPGNNRLYIVEQAGTIRRTNPGSSDTQLFLDISSKVVPEGEQGLLGLAFHPDYAQNGFIFVNYINHAQDTVVARYTVKDDAVDTGSEKIILTQEQPYTNHNGGDIVFGPDGFLYIALGDGGQAGDPHDNAQNLGNWLGKILRIDVNTEQPYIVPTDNPFVGQENARPEVWAYGLRNPWRISFDSKTGDFYIADVGQNVLEEVNFQPASSKGGENYGWRCYEGSQAYNLEGCAGVNMFVPPVVEYNHDAGRCSITGGYVSRAASQPALGGKYFYGDFCGGQLYYAEKNDNTWHQTLALETDFAISTFGIDASGEIYLADYTSGGVYKIGTATP